MNTLKEIIYTPNLLEINGQTISLSELNPGSVYRSLIGGYPKFFKMDGLCKVGFIAAELLLKDIPQTEKEHLGVILFNRSGSLVTDRNYQQTISDKENYFPSPALFVYTLANIVTGEIAIRHKIYGETSFYVLDSPDEKEMAGIVGDFFATSAGSMVMTGWVEYETDEDFTVRFKLIKNS